MIDILNEHSKTGFEFEFYTNLSNNELKSKLEQLFDKKIVFDDKYHSDAKYSDKVFKIEPDFSAGSLGKELVTGPLLHSEAKVVFEKMTNFIRRYGWTDSKCAFQPNISYNKEAIESLQHTFNPIKFILDLDEERIYEKFPERRNNLYAKSIKKMKPSSSLFTISESGINSNVLKYPTTKYYGVNLEKLSKDYLEVRYLGGANYECKATEITEVWEYMIESIYNAANPETNTLEKSHIDHVKGVFEKHKEFSKKLSSAKNIAENYPNIKFAVDLERFPKYIDQKLYLLKDRLLELFSDNNFEETEGIINYDSDKGKFQLKNFKLENGSFINADFVNCELLNCTVAENSEIHKSKVKSCDVESSKLYGSKVVSSRVKNSFVDKKNDLSDTYISGRLGMFDGNLTSGIFREGNILRNARFNDKKTEIIEYKKI